MRSAPVAAPAPLARPAPVATRAAALAVYCRVGAHVLALDGARVEHMLLVDEVEAQIRGPASTPGLARIRGRWYGTRSAAELLGVKARAGAIVLVRLPAPGEPVIALEVGARAPRSPRGPRSARCRRA